MYARIRPRRGTKGQFEAVNPVLKEGEMAIETDDNGTGKGLVNIKFGDGVTDYKNLPYAVRGKDISDTPAVFEDDVEFIEDEEILSGMVAGKIFKLIKKKLSLLTAELANALSIAQGKNRSHVFQTEVQLDEWLSNADNVATLKIGDNLYIVELNVPDYWWDGAQKQRLETVKVDLNEFYNKEEVDAKDQNIMGMLSDEFSTEKTYAIGELFIYNNKIYKVTSAIEHPGEFDLDYVEEVTLSGALNQSLTSIETDTYANEYTISDVNVVKVGKVVTIAFPSLKANIPINQSIKLFELDDKYKISSSLGIGIVRVPDANNNNEVVTYFVSGNIVYFYKYGTGKNATTSNCTLTYITD